jgi:ABC-2 type transport system permease protein
MWFSNVYLKTLRDYRVAILGWGIGMGLLMYAVLVSYPSLVATAAARASLITLSKSFTALAEPIGIGTPGGYATFKVGFTILLITLWPLLAGSRMLRGEEERGSLDVLLTTPESRVQVALQKLAAMWTALLSMGLLISLITFAAGRSVSATFTLTDALLFGLNLVLICGVFGNLALLLSQFTQERRTAAGITGGLLLLAIVLDMVHRVIPGTDWISKISPVYYFNLSKPLVPTYAAGYPINAGALLVLLVLAVVFAGAGVWLFVGRDVGGVVALPSWLRLPERTLTPEQALPDSAWSLQSVYSRSLAAMAVPTFWWTVGIAGFAAWMVVIVQKVEAQLAAIYQGSPMLQFLVAKVGGGDVATNATILSTLFVFLPLLLMAFAVTQANSWSSDEQEGRLDLLLSTPQSRLSVLLARFGALTTGTVLIGLLTLAATAIASAATGIKLDGGNLIVATLTMIPLGLLVAALGYLLSGWLSTVIDTGILSFLLVIWFVITFIGQSLGWPSGTLKLSAFYYYGTPLLNGLSLGNLLLILVLGAAALVVATMRFTRKDIAR